MSAVPARTASASPAAAPQPHPGLSVRVGQHSDAGRRPVNQDFFGFTVPPEPLLASKGVAIALADGIGSSDVSQVASEFAVMGFLDDYYCTSEAWSVKRSAERVLAATNSWLHSRTRQSPYRYDMDRGYVCTLSALVIKAGTAHVFHVGDTRIYRAHGNALEQLTDDHRIRVSETQSYLARAIGFNAQVEIDYRALEIARGDLFLLATDGVYEHVDDACMIAAIARAGDDLDAAARDIVEEAFRRGSDDNLTVQIVRIEELPPHGVSEVHARLSALPLPPLLEARQALDGYSIVRELHASHRSHIYLAFDADSEVPVVLKAPAVDLASEPAALERFLMEEWVARRINSPHVLKPYAPSRERSALYIVTEYVEGQTLAQWMIDNPRPDLETVRGLVEQMARGLQAFHRLEMLHQDLRPENVLIDRTGTVKIIDFGSVRVAGISELEGVDAVAPILGTAQYTAPEYFLGEPGTWRSDLFSLAVITYQMLSGRLPYGAEVAKTRTVAAQMKLPYQSVLDDEREIPVWIDGVLRKALHPNPLRRHEALSEFVHELRHPNRAFIENARPPVIERHPVLFWKTVSAVLAVMVFVLIFSRFGVPHP